MEPMRQLLLMDRHVGEQPWELDTEKSFAKMEITPVRCGDELMFRCTEALEIKPYPNPRMFGGMWCYGGLDTEDEVKKRIEEFHKWADEWVGKGMKIEIIRHPEES